MDIKYYLYRHIRVDKNEPFYIGIGTKTNADVKYGTYTRANVKNKRNNIWINITKKTLYNVEILFESINYELIKQKEIEFIKLHGRIDLKTGTLSNQTDGGEGTTNIIVSQKARELRSKAQKGRQKSTESINKRINTIKINGFKLSESSRRQISLTKSKAVLQFSLTGELLKKWSTVVEASENLNILKVSICQCANRNNQRIFTAFNYIWVYLEDFNSNNLDKFNIALDRVKQGKIKLFITLNKKLEIINDYIKIDNTFVKKKDKLMYLTVKHNLNYSTIRAIISNMKTICINLTK